MMEQKSKGPLKLIGSMMTINFKKKKIKITMS